MVNLVRKEVVFLARSQISQYRTRELLNFWFLNEERADDQKLFYAQQEAIEIAVWLNVVQSPGSNIYFAKYSDYQKVSPNDADNLPRIGQILQAPVRW